MRMAKPIFPWMGNKVKLLPFIQKMIPPNVKQYLEPFGGSGAVVLGLKPKKYRLDIYNDLDSDLSNLFLCVRDRLIELLPDLLEKGEAYFAEKKAAKEAEKAAEEA